MITKKFGVDFHSRGGALTLGRSEVCEDKTQEHGTHTRTHPDGWAITGELHEDWFVWVNDFEAHHPQYGRVWGNFEKEVYADSEEGFQHFYTHHQPNAWDYWDI